MIGLKTPSSSFCLASKALVSASAFELNHLSTY